MPSKWPLIYQGYCFIAIICSSEKVTTPSPTTTVIAFFMDFGLRGPVLKLAPHQLD